MKYCIILEHDELIKGEFHFVGVAEVNQDGTITKNLCYVSDYIHGDKIKNGIYVSENEIVAEIVAENLGEGRFNCKKVFKKNAHAHIEDGKKFLFFDATDLFEKVYFNRKQLNYDAKYSRLFALASLFVIGSFKAFSAENSVPFDVLFAEIKSNKNFNDTFFEKLNERFFKSQTMSHNEDKSRKNVPELKYSTKEDNKSANKFNVDYVNELKNKLKGKIIGQDKCVNKLVNTIIWNQRMIQNDDSNIIETQKSNIFIDGPTGTGKTLMCKSLAKELELPMIKRNITDFSNVGYKGADLTAMLVDLLAASNGDLNKAQSGIIVLDEIDKLGNGLKNSDSSIAASNVGLQNELLQYIGGSTIKIEYDGKSIDFDTSKVTFIALGAFTDLRKDKNQKNNRSQIGFSHSNESKKEEKDEEYKLTQDDYIKAGLQEELVRRFNTIMSTNELKIPELIGILSESSISPLKSLIDASKIFGSNITYDSDTVKAIAECAYRLGGGARALSTVCNTLKEEYLIEKIFEGEDIYITSSMIHDLSIGKKEMEKNR